MSTKLERFLAVKERFELTDEQFAKKIGVTRSNINKIKAGQKIEGKTLTGLFNGFPTLNKDWFIYGTGDMLNKEYGSSTEIKTVAEKANYNPILTTQDDGEDYPKIVTNAKKAFVNYYEQMNLISRLMQSKQEEYQEVYEHLIK